MACNKCKTNKIIKKFQVEENMNNNNNKLKCEKKNKYLDLARELKKL